MTARWFSHLVCLLGLPLYVWGIEGQRHTGALPADVSVHSLRFPVRIQGVPAETRDHLRSLVERYEPGTRIGIESAGSLRVVTVQPAFSKSHLLISLISALFFWAVAFFVFAERPERDPGRVFFLSTFCYGLAICVGTIAFPAGRQWFDLARPVVRSLCIAVLPVFFVQMALLFPRRRRVVDAKAWLIPALFVTALGLAAWRSTVLLRYFAYPTPIRWNESVWSERGLDLFLAGLVTAGGVLMYRTGQRAELTRERRQLKWLWWGIIVGTTPFVFLHTLPLVLLGREFMPLHVTRLFAMAVPISFTFAAVRYKLLDIDVIIQRSLIYGMLAGVLAAVYLLLAELIGRRIATYVPGSAPYVPVTAALVSVLLFSPTRRWIGGWVDRTFFKIRHSYGLALRRFRVAITRSGSQAELAQFLRRFVNRMLAPKTCSVVVRFGSELFMAGRIDQPLAHWSFAHFDRIVELREGAIAAPDATSLPETETAEFPERLLASGILLVQPLTGYRELHGIILVGEKRSERRYIEDDLTLLSGVAAIGSVTLERLNLAQRVAEERIGRERLDEINRMKSDFLSRVAHDLRTPLTSIDWSARNLLDGLAGKMLESQTAYVEAISASAVHLGRLVSNLLEISRLEEGRAEIELQPVRTVDAIDEAVTGLRAIAGAKAIRFECRVDRALGPVVAHRDRLVQALVNLLENAVRYTPYDSVIEIALERAGTDVQRLSVRDAGPGVPPGDEEAIFERFRQGPPSPHAQPQGFGLGLYVVRAHVEAFSGTVCATNHPSGGAEFVVMLRDWNSVTV